MLLRMCARADMRLELYEYSFTLPSLGLIFHAIMDVNLKMKNSFEALELSLTFSSQSCLLCDFHVIP